MTMTDQAACLRCGYVKSEHGIAHFPQARRPPLVICPVSVREQGIGTWKENTTKSLSRAVKGFPC